MGTRTYRLSPGNSPLDGASGTDPLWHRPKLCSLYHSTGRVVRRMESTYCGEMVHIHVKQLGEIAPVAAGGCSDALADRHRGMTRNRKFVRGYHFIHTAIDAYSDLAYSELLPDERKDTAAEFWSRANTWFNQCGIRTRKDLTRSAPKSSSSFMRPSARYLSYEVHQSWMTIEAVYENWVATRTPPLFGTEPDARAWALVSEVSDPSVYRYLPFGRWLNRPTQSCIPGMKSKVPQQIYRYISSRTIQPTTMKRNICPPRADPRRASSTTGPPDRTSLISRGSSAQMICAGWSSKSATRRRTPSRLRRSQPRKSSLPPIRTPLRSSKHLLLQSQRRRSPDDLGFV